MQTLFRALLWRVAELVLEALIKALREIGPLPEPEKAKAYRVYGCAADLQDVIDDSTTDADDDDEVFDYESDVDDADY